MSDRPRPLLPARTVDEIERLPDGVYEDEMRDIHRKLFGRWINRHTGRSGRPEAIVERGGLVDILTPGCRTCADQRQVVMPPGGGVRTRWYESCPDCQEGEG